GGALFLLLRRAFVLRPGLTAVLGGLAVAAAAAPLPNFFPPFDAAPAGLAVHAVAAALRPGFRRRRPARGLAPPRPAGRAARRAAELATPLGCRQLSTNGLESSTTRSAFGYQPCAAWVSSCR